jgi:DNA invertase Pin-like site-specific DNA recombinase
VRVVGYVRVSTSTQAEDGYGLAIQKAAVREWCKTNGHRLVAILCDEGISGAKELEDRPGLADALGMLRDKQAQGIVVPRMGGIAFSTSPAEASYLTDDPDDPSRKMIRQVLGAVAEYERSMVVLRLRNGRRRKAQMGGYASGAPAFGYEARDKALVESDEEQETLKRIIELRDSGASLRGICSTLESEGRKSKRAGSSWQPMTVKRALDRMARTA